VSHREVIITQTKVRVLRAGVGLLILPMAAIMSLLFHQLATDYSESSLIHVFAAALGGLLGLLYFATICSRISDDDGVIHILRALDEVVFLANTIVATKIWVLRPSSWAVVAVHTRARRFPFIFHFVVLSHSSAGNLTETVTALKRLLERPADSDPTSA
jgi:hypothetical protein